jgi:hypothetical protein
VVARQVWRELAGQRNVRKPLRRLALRRNRRRVSASAFIVNPWVAQFRNDPSTRGNDTVLKNTSRAQQRLFSRIVRWTEGDAQGCVPYSEFCAASGPLSIRFALGNPHPPCSGRRDKATEKWG